MSRLSAEQRRSFRENGFLVLPGFFRDDELATALEAYQRVWRERPWDVVVDTTVTRRRIRAIDMTEDERRDPFKVNDLYLTDSTLRQALLSQRLGLILAELLGDEPVICNTLSMEFGSQQPDHLDTLFMTPKTDGRLIATWMALEDVDADAGPLRYYPESNHIEPFRFRDGSFHINAYEMPRWGDYMASEVDRYGLAETRFLAKKGDLFIWDAWLLHGGSEICKPGLTRNSLVTHYFTRTDCSKLGSDLGPADGGWWLRREGPRATHGPDDDPAPQAMAPDIPQLGAPPADDGDVLPGRDLRTRLDSLDPHDDKVGP